MTADLEAHAADMRAVSVRPVRRTGCRPAHRRTKRTANRLSLLEVWYCRVCQVCGRRGACADREPLVDLAILEGYGFEAAVRMGDFMRGGIDG